MLQLGLFDRAFYINLDARPDRRIETEIELAKAGITATRVAAVSPEDSDEIVLRRLGCKLSHLNIVKRAKAENLASVLVIEDDILFVPNLPETLSRSIEDLKEVKWDLFYLGYESFGNPRGTISPHTPYLARTQSTYLTHCYAVNASAYNNYIRFVLESRLGDAIDNILADNYAAFQVYCSTPRVAFQRPGFSDIERCEIPNGR